MRTPVETLLAVADIGGKLGIAEGERLRMLLPPDCPAGLKDAIRHHKGAMLGLLRLNFLVVRSDALDATVLWAPDQATKDALLAAGADAGRIYTPDELRQVVSRRVTVEQLRLIHAAKLRFKGKLAEP